MFRRAFSYVIRGAPRKGAAMLRAHLAVHRNDAGARLWLGVALADADDFEAGLDEIQSSGAQAAPLFRARVLFDSGRFAEARDLLLGEIKDNASGQALLAACLITLGELDEAQREVRRAMPQVPWVLARLLLAIESSAPDRPPAPTPRPEPGKRALWPGNALRRGLLLMRSEKWSAALAVLESAEAGIPGDPRVGYGIGVSLYYLQHYAESRRRLEEVLGGLEDPFYGDALGTLGRIDLQEGRITDGVLKLRRAIAAGAATPENHYFLGLAFLRARRPDLARKAFAKCASAELVWARFNDIMVRRG